MELQETSSTPSESLRVIESFIDKTKRNLRARSFDLLLWGILVALASLAHYFLLTSFQYENAWLPWPILMIGGSIFTSIYHATNKKEKQVRTFADVFLMWLSICSGVIFFVIAFLCVRQSISPFPFMLAHTSVLIFVTGAILRFKPLVAGGILFMVSSIVSSFLPYESQLLFCAAVVIIGYLVPGILIRKEKD
jgi:FtsH-binding integral membrane protein